MIIKMIAVGNTEEAYVEKGFSPDKINIIFSDDNNKGKTILVQSMMYALGNNPLFPKGFDHEEYYHMLVFALGGKEYLLCRKKDAFLISSNGTLFVFNSKSEFKRYWSKNIFSLPKIVKDHRVRIVDPELFLEMFFVGQDRKTTDGLASSKWYRKDDFYNMLYSLKEIDHHDESEVDPREIKETLTKLTKERKNLLKANSILKSTADSASYISKTVDVEGLEDKIKRAEIIRKKISDLKKERSKAVTLKNDNLTTLENIQSLNRSIALGGEVRCSNCNSDNIQYVTSKNSYSFDISTADIRNKIIHAIHDKISAYDEDIERLTFEINLHQNKLQDILSERDITLASLLIYKKEDISGIDKIDQKIYDVDREIAVLTARSEMREESSKDAVSKRNVLKTAIVAEINKQYRIISNDDSLHFDDIFTRYDQNISGSQLSEFNAAKLYALAKVMQHGCPVVIDSFRAEDLSTDREERLLTIYNDLSNQIIITTTIKMEEVGKYDDVDFINPIDFSSYETYKLLQPKYCDEFLELLKGMHVTV